jgi:DNA-binding MarR family transcriptional regulator
VAGHDDAELHGLLLQLVRSVGLLQVVDAGPAGQVSLSELFALHELDSGGDLTQQELAARLRLDKSTVSRLVAGLEERGLLARERDPGNRRLVRLTITEGGHRLHRGLARAMHDHQQTVLAAMTATERVALGTGLTGLLRALHVSASIAPAGHAPASHVPAG